VFYRLCNLVLGNGDLLLSPYLPDEIVDVQILRDLRLFQTPSHWFMEWHLPSGELWLSFAKVDGGYRLRFEKLADFFVSTDGQKITYQPLSSVPSNTIRHLILDQIIPLVINLKGGEALHASAMLTEEGAIAFAGNTGSGKSTVAATFLQAGHPLLSDDCLALEEKDGKIYAMPAYPGLRLWKDAADELFGEGRTHTAVAHYASKKQVDIEPKPETFCSEPKPLKRLYVIADPSESNGRTDIVIDPLGQRDSFMALIEYAFRLDITDKNMLTRQFRFFERVVSKVSVRKLTYPRDFKFLPAVREAILKDLEDLNI